MLLECVKIMQDRYIDPERGFLALQQWVAIRLPPLLPHEGVAGYPYGVTVTLSMDKCLKKTFDLTLLQEDPWDWWGDTAQSLRLATYIPYRHRKDTLTELLLPRLNRNASITDIFYDPHCGTGRTFLAAHATGWPGIYCGVETNPKAYRLCLLNIATHNLPAYVIQKPTPPQMDHPNWEKYNTYNNINFSFLNEVLQKKTIKE